MLVFSSVNQATLPEIVIRKTNVSAASISSMFVVSLVFVASAFMIYPVSINFYSSTELFYLLAF
jgi:hypothetical protein